jgi:hypothetical protein
MNNFIANKVKLPKRKYREREKHEKNTGKGKNMKKIQEYSNPTKVNYKHFKALRKIQKGGSHLEMQLLTAVAHYDG